METISKMEVFYFSFSFVGIDLLLDLNLIRSLVEFDDELGHKVLYFPLISLYEVPKIMSLAPAVSTK